MAYQLCVRAYRNTKRPAAIANLDRGMAASKHIALVRVVLHRKIVARARSTHREARYARLPWKSALLWCATAQCQPSLQWLELTSLERAPSTTLFYWSTNCDTGVLLVP